MCWGSCSNYTQEIHYSSMYIIILYGVSSVPSDQGSCTVYPTCCVLTLTCRWVVKTEQLLALWLLFSLFPVVLTQADCRHPSQHFSSLSLGPIKNNSKASVCSPGYDTTSQSHWETLWKLENWTETVYHHTRPAEKKVTLNRSQYFVCLF